MTGGGGFIGIQVTLGLLKAGAAVRLIGPTARERLESSGVLGKPELEERTGPLLGEADFAAALADCDSLVHLGYHAPIATGAQQRLTEELATNLQETVGLAAAADRAGTSFVAFASTVAVYAPSPAGVGEETPVADELTPYAQAKLAQEACLREWARGIGRRAAILRLATVYGPGETVPRAIPNFIRAALSGRPAVLEGDGSSSFDLIFVVDVARAFVAATERRVDGVYNIGTGVGRTAREVEELVRELCGSSLDAVEDHAQPNRPRAICDVSRAAAEIGFRATTPLETGLAEEIRWFRGRAPVSRLGGNRQAAGG